MIATPLSPATSLARGLAAALGVFAVANSVLGTVFSGTPLDQNIWWIDSRPVPSWLANPLVLLSGLLLLAWAAWPNMSQRRRLATRTSLAVLFAASFWNTLCYWALLVLGSIQSPIPTPLSLGVAVLLAWLWNRTASPGTSTAVNPVAPSPRARIVHRILMLFAFLSVPILFPLAQMFAFGLTDYRRPADAAVVFGAAVWPGDIPSHALRDRVNTGLELYKSGQVAKLVFSGGPSSQPDISHEVIVMKRMALDAGVPERALVLDFDGTNTQATVDNCRSLFPAHGIHRALAVSHFYHLPRVKLAFGRASLEVFTVPAKEPQLLLKLPYFMAREVAALWAYYLDLGR